MGENPLQVASPVSARTESGGVGPSAETRDPVAKLFAMRDEFMGTRFESGPQILTAVSHLNRETRVAYGGGLPYAVALLGNYSRAEEKLMSSGLDFNKPETRIAAKSMRDAVLQLQLKIAELGEPNPDLFEPAPEIAPGDPSAPPEQDARIGQYL